MTGFSLDDDLSLALTLAAEADLISLDRFQASDLDVSLKADRSHVTDADTRVERVIRDRLAAARPADSILGEEFGAAGGGAPNPQPGRQWIVDPIDGTANFLRGVPIWGTLLSLAIDGVPQVGVVTAPALGRRWWGATGHGAWGQHGDAEPRRLRVSDVATLSEANVSYNSFQYWDEAGRLEQLTALNRAAWRSRAIGDLWSYMLLAEGSFDLVSELDLKPWDLAAIAPVVREAGGTLTSADGEDSIWTGTVLATNGRVHAEALSIIRAT